MYYEIAHFHFLRKIEAGPREKNMDVDDIVVDEYGDVLWRLRALYGLKNARGTRSLAIGGLIVIDFIHMKEPAHYERVLAALRHSLARDGVPVNIGKVTDFGLVFFVMRLKLHGFFDDFSVNRVQRLAPDLHDNRFFHFVREHNPDSFFS